MASPPPLPLPPPPPCYTPSAPAPTYSCHPAPTERRLAQTQTRRRRASRSPGGAFVRAEQGVSVVLEDQDPGGVPTYGHNARVAGAVCVDDASRVTGVAIRLEGRIQVGLLGDRTGCAEVVDVRRTLWEGAACPAVLVFDLPLPRAFGEGERTRPLPPSYEITFSTYPELQACVAYALTVLVTATSTSRIAFWPRRTSIVIPLRYAPRAHPPRPLIPGPVLASLKAAPEEWHQVIATIDVRQPSNLTPITATLLLPSIRIFALPDALPLHLQLAGAPASLAALSRARIRVLLRRQVAVAASGMRARRTALLGAAALAPVPPPHAAGGATLDWAGAVRCEGAAVGGFSAGELIVEDFVVLVVEPEAGSALLPAQCAHPVRLVSDPWVETDG